MTAPSDISVDGYSGKTFQRTVPDVLSGCPNMSPGHMRLPELDGNGLNSWLNEDSSNFAGCVLRAGAVRDLDGPRHRRHGRRHPLESVGGVIGGGSRRVRRRARLDPHRPPALPNVPGDGPLEPGTYYVDEVNGTPTPRIFATLDSGWGDRRSGDGWLHRQGGHPDEGGIGLMTITNPVAVFSDACHPTDGFYPGSVATVDGFVTALREQQGGWVDVTEPSDISVDGYVGKAFQRTAPAVMSGCTTRDGGDEDPQGSGPSPELGERRRNQHGLRTGRRSRPCGSSTSTARSSSSARNCGRGHRRRLTLISPTRCSTRSASTGHERRARRCAVPFIAPDHVVIRGRPTPR